jgi:hypothetical protein
LPATETFVSHANNALKSSTVSVSGNSFSIVLPTVSTTAVILKSTTTAVEIPQINSEEIKLFPNPVRENLSIALSSQTPALTEVSVYSQDGKLIDTFLNNYDGSTPIKINTNRICNGLYLLKLKNKNVTGTKMFCVLK